MAIIRARVFSYVPVVPGLGFLIMVENRPRLSGNVWKSINHHSHRCGAFRLIAAWLASVNFGLVSASHSDIGLVLDPQVAIAAVSACVVFRTRCIDLRISMVKSRILILRLSGTLWESINHYSHRCRSLFGGFGSETTTFRLDTVGIGLASSNLGLVLVPHVAISTVPPCIVTYLPSEDEIRLNRNFIPN